MTFGPLLTATVLVVTAQSGATLERTYETHAMCEAAMEYVMAVEDMTGVDYPMIQCRDTDQITVSPRPPKRPEGM